MISVLIADDHISVLNSLFTLLESVGDLQIVTTASNGEEAVAQASLYCPDVAVIDVSMPVMDGIEATRQISELCPQTRVVMLSIFNNTEYVQRALRAGASGYVLKDSAGDDLVTAIRSVYAGNRYFSQRIAGNIENHTHEKGNDDLTDKSDQG